AVEGDRLGDGHAAEPARIEHGDLSARRGLGNGAVAPLARRSAPPRVGVITDPGHPGPRRLREREGRAHDGAESEGERGADGTIHRIPPKSFNHGYFREITAFVAHTGTTPPTLLPLR